MNLPMLLLMLVQEPMPLARLSGPVQLDGRVDEAAWLAVAPLPVTMYTPVFRGAPSESTVVRVAYDDDYLYAAALLYDSRPDQIRVNSLVRDRWSGDDAFALYLDPFNDNESGVWFLTNAAGVRIDYGLTGDGLNANVSWNTFWDAAAQITPQGWAVEMRIPWSSLRFQDVNGQVVMGLSLTRWHARTNERVTFPAIDPRYNFRASSRMQDVVVSGVRPARPAYLTPYALSGRDRTPARSTGTSDAGADFRFAPSENVNLDLSVNTDFAQVEADDAQINLTRFPLFYPEKRQFFQERAGVFDFTFESGGRLFHSRQIGLAPDRTPIRILGGARLAMRAGDWDIGVLDMETARRDSVQAENLGVVRVKKRVLNSFSYVGGMLTSRANNLVAGVDASLRVVGNDWLTVRAAGEGAELDRSQVYVEWRNRSDEGLEPVLISVCEPFFCHEQKGQEDGLRTGAAGSAAGGLQTTRGYARARWDL